MKNSQTNYKIFTKIENMSRTNRFTIFQEVITTTICQGIQSYIVPMSHRVGVHFEYK